MALATWIQDGISGERYGSSPKVLPDSPVSVGLRLTTIFGIPLPANFAQIALFDDQGVALGREFGVTGFSGVFSADFILPAEIGIYTFGYFTMFPFPDEAFRSLSVVYILADEVTLDLNAEPERVVIGTPVRIGALLRIGGRAFPDVPLTFKIYLPGQGTITVDTVTNSAGSASTTVRPLNVGPGSASATANLAEPVAGAVELMVVAAGEDPPPKPEEGGIPTGLLVGGALVGLGAVALAASARRGR